MLILTSALLFLGTLVAVISALWTLALAFQRHALWGLSVLFLPFGSVVFAAARWREAKVPFTIGACSLLLVGTALAAVPTESLPPSVRTILKERRRSQLDRHAAMAAMRANDLQELRLGQLKRRETVLLKQREELVQGDPMATATLTSAIHDFNDEVDRLLAGGPSARLVIR